MREGIGVIPYFSLARGLSHRQVPLAKPTSARARAGKGMKKFLNERGHAILARARRRGASDCRATPAQVALAWLMTRPGVTAPIASATSVAQLDEIMAATRLRSTRTTRRTLDRRAPEG